MSPPRGAEAPGSFGGLRVGVVGLGIEGQDAVRFLQAEGAVEIVISEHKPAAALREPLRTLAGIPFALEAGGNTPALAERVDALFVSQGVPDDLPLLQAARERGVPLVAMMQLFLRRCPTPAVGISGSAGKTTTTALVGEMFRAAGRRVFVGGNIGQGLLSALPTIDAETSVVLEISHTQLLRTDRSPHLAAVLGVTPNHLDHFSWDEYVNLKRNLVRHQSATDLVVLPAYSEPAGGFAADTPARLFSFGVGALRGPGARVQREVVVWDGGAGPQAVLPVSAIPLPGRHNLRNVLAAVAIGGAWGLPAAAMAAAIRAFRGMPHRLETVAEAADIRYIDDSIATAPERTLAALQAVAGPVVLLLGGREKRLPLEMLAREALSRTRRVVCFGEAGPLFAAALRAQWAGQSSAPPIEETPDLPAAVAAARAAAQPGDAVLLSPAGTSFDQYENFAARGDHFRALVRAAVTAAAPEDADGKR